jgi:predicted DNA-binding transcriptional regulator YafY
MNRQRIIYVQWLLKKHTHKGVVVQKTVEEFNVSRRTVYYDINKVCKKTNNQQL